MQVPRLVPHLRLKTPVPGTLVSGNPGTPPLWGSIRLAWAQQTRVPRFCVALLRAWLRAGWGATHAAGSSVPLSCCLRIGAAHVPAQGHGQTESRASHCAQSGARSCTWTSTASGRLTWRRCCAAAWASPRTASASAPATLPGHWVGAVRNLLSNPSWLVHRISRNLPVLRKGGTSAACVQPCVCHFWGSRF